MSCREEFFLEPEESSPNLNFISELSTESPISATLSTTVPFGAQEGSELPPDAMVFFSGSDLPVLATAMTFNDNRGFYELRRFDFKPTQGNTYEIKAFLPNSSFDTLSATTYIPRSGRISQVNTLSVSKREVSINEEHYIIRVSVSLAEPRDLPAYFQIIPHRVLTTFRTDSDGNVLFTDHNELEELKIKNVLSDRNAVFEFSHKNGIFIDYSRLQDNNIELELETSEPLSRHSEVIRLLNIQLNTLAPELYYYNSFLNDQFRANKTTFSYPVNSYSNINNGIGIFGGYSTVRVNTPL